MKNLLFLFLLPFFVYSQFCPALGPDQLLPCGVGSTTLTADLNQCGPGGNNPNQTTNYSVLSIPYVNQTNTGTSLFMTDDSQQGPFNIGFTFCFFGQTYTQFWVGSNGWISFSPGQPTTFITQAIPTGNALVPKNCIMGPWQDWHPGNGGQIRYQTSGVAPCRKLTVSWIGVPMYNCNWNTGTFHIVIYESTNYIESHIQNKPACLNWQGGTAIQGIHNLAGTLASAVPGRNSTAWTTTNDSWRWTPSGPVVLPVLTWYQIGNLTPIGTGPTITVTPPAAGAQYTCQFVYPICNTGWSICNQQQGGLGPDTVFVLPGPPNLPQPTIFNINPTCNSYCDGSIFVLPNGGSGVQTISWNGPQQGLNPTGLCDGVYTLTLIDALGCDVTTTVTLIDPPLLTINTITGQDTICINSVVNLYDVSSITPNLNYVWLVNSGTISSGQGSTQINIDATGSPSGFYNGMISVYGVDGNGCTSQVQNYNINIYNETPIITPVGPFCSYDEFLPLQSTPINGVFSGNGVIGNDFYPSNAVGTNTITYVYTQSGCVFSTTTDIIVYPQPILDSITPYNPFYELCEGDSTNTLFSAIADLPGYNVWTLLGVDYQTDLFNTTWDSEGMFIISVVHYSNGCVSNQQETVIVVENCPEELIYIPNTFTPDGNEHNQTFLPVFTSGFDPYDYQLLVFNRWGNLIFESNDHKSGWDGTFNNGYAQDGTYTWVIRYGNVENDKKTEIRGFITILK